MDTRWPKRAERGCFGGRGRRVLYCGNDRHHRIAVLRPSVGECGFILWSAGISRLSGIGSYDFIRSFGRLSRERIPHAGFRNMAEHDRPLGIGQRSSIYLRVQANHAGDRFLAHRRRPFGSRDFHDRG